jgi:hypothetical protein
VVVVARVVRNRKRHCLRRRKSKEKEKVKNFMSHVCHERIHISSFPVMRFLVLVNLQSSFTTLLEYFLNMGCIECIHEFVQRLWGRRAAREFDY